jgi:TRAP-type C4-dicarboxylate transport system substrate-binding protein
VRVLVKRLQRKGVDVSLVGGLMQVDGWKQLPPEEQEALHADRERIVAWLAARELKRQRRAERKRREEEQHVMANPPERPRKVVGQQVVPSYPQLARPLYADEVKEIDVCRARVLGTVPYGWKVGE